MAACRRSCGTARGLIRTGPVRPGYPSAGPTASTFRSALSIDLLNALSRRSWTSSWSSPPPQEASARAAKSRRTRARRTRRRLAGRHRNSARFVTLEEEWGTCRTPRSRAAATPRGRPAMAGEVIVVDGDHAKRVNDPVVPTRPSAPCPEPRARGRGGAPARARARQKSGRARRLRALDGPAAPKRITTAPYRRWRAIYVRSARTLRQPARRARDPARLRDRSVEALALRRRLERHSHAGRLPAARAQPPVLAAAALPGLGDQVSFKGSEILFQYFPGRACSSTRCRPSRRRTYARRLRARASRLRPRRPPPLLDEMTALAVRRGRASSPGSTTSTSAAAPRPGSAAWRRPPASRRSARGRSCSATALRRDREQGAAALRDAAAGRRADARPPRRHPLPAVLVRAPDVHLQRVPAVADRPVRLPDLTGDARAALYEQAEPEAAARCRSATSATGRATATAASLRHPLPRAAARVPREHVLPQVGDEYCVYAKKYRGYRPTRRC